MDTAHRDRLAFIRICSGVFERGMVVTHARTGRPFATKYAQHVFGRERESIDLAYPGDVVGLVNAAALGVGDTLYAERPVTFPPLTTFAPEHFAVCRGKDTAKHKQFRRGIEQLDSEGVVQVLRSDRRGDQAPVLAVVGPMQFEVAQHRMEHEFNAPIELERLPYSLALRTDEASAPKVSTARGAEVLQRTNGELHRGVQRQVGAAGVQGEQPRAHPRVPGRRAAVDAPDRPRDRPALPARARRHHLGGRPARARRARARRSAGPGPRYRGWRPAPSTGSPGRRSPSWWRPGSGTSWPRATVARPTR